MAKVPLPERGQPIDVAYLYQLSNAINQLSDQVSSSTYNYTTVDTPSAGKQNMKTSEVRFVGGIRNVASQRTVDATEVVPWEYPFDVNFAYTPVVTATPVNTGTSTAGENVSVVITRIDKSGVSGIVRFNAQGVVSTAVHIIAVGIPN